MKLLLEKFESKTPHYPDIYRELIDSLSRKKEVSTSDKSDAEQFEKGKAFGTYYECYMYAVMIGIKAKNRLAFNRAEGTKFLPIGDWRPKQITQYLFMSLLALADFQFELIEDLTEEQANEKANELLHLMEGYAKGGFEILAKQVKDDPSYFENTLNVVGFLKQSENVL
jgi:3'-phosphoadenosine 5'-phosphosulfate sulfotransferase (PAPS reductase)/FAD synthetase